MIAITGPNWRLASAPITTKKAAEPAAIKAGPIAEEGAATNANPPRPVSRGAA